MEHTSSGGGQLGAENMFHFLWERIYIYVSFKSKIPQIQRKGNLFLQKLNCLYLEMCVFPLCAACDVCWIMGTILSHMIQGHMTITRAFRKHVTDLYKHSPWLNA